MDIGDLGKLGDMAKQMQDAYSEGSKAMNKAGKAVAKDVKPDHEIELNIKLSAKVEGHDYEVDTKVTFKIELNPILSLAASPKGDLSVALEGLDTDLGDDKDAIIEQLGQPRAVGVVKKIKTKKLVLYNDSGKVKAKLNKDGTLLATIKKDKILINCESVFSFPKHTDVYVAIPSMEAMQKNIVVPIKNKSKKVTFSWKEKGKDNLKVEGSVKICKL